MEKLQHFSCFEEWHELSMQKQWEIVKQLQMQSHACKRYFEHCQRTNVSSNHKKTDSVEMSIRMSLRKDATDALGLTGE